MTTTVKAIKCLKCNDIIYSRARYDYKRCSCKRTIIDGGLHWIRTSGEYEKDNDNNIKFYKIEIDATEVDLYYDWFHNKNQYGTIHEQYDDEKDHTKCSDCNGTGKYIGFTDKRNCPTCDGSGYI